MHKEEFQKKVNPLLLFRHEIRKIYNFNFFNTY